ncbi:MAG: RNA polymerase sigma factor [Flavobacteriaceae bacterium]|nr:RNA polymerase sigma factor [Flavobacteriaceae bacterium]
MTIKDDQYYITKITQGDTNSFTVLVDRYKDLVYTLAIRMLKNKEEAEEVSQDTFLKVFKSLAKFKGESKFSSWIYRIAYNTCLDKIRKQKRDPIVVTIDEFTEHQVITVDNALDKLIAQERKQVIHDCLQLLPSDVGFLLTLYYFEEQSIEEISKVIGISTANVKVKLFRSRKKLATILRKRLEPEIINYYER